MVSDSDGKQFPWYGSKTEVCLIKGPKSMHSVYEVRMNDNFYPHVTWDIPTSNEKIPRLTRVNREQSFLTWLVAMNVVTGRFLVLKTIKWHMLLELDIDPRKELGKRVRLVNGAVPSQPILLDKNIRIPKCALYPANANSSQYLVWRPSGHNSIPKIIVQPKSCNHHFENDDDKYQNEDEIINID